MKTKLRRFKAITEIVHGLEMGVVERKAVLRVLKKLEHGLQTKNIKATAKAVDELSSFFVLKMVTD